MRNKELLLRRMQTLEGMLKKLRLALNGNDIIVGRKLVNELVEMKEEISSIIEREN
tara:strand:+ start:345 stop:512 length:168 start_codon:yes stop_codon:yes gene_type:complete